MPFLVLVPAVALLTACASPSNSTGLSLEESCASLSGITTQLAEGIGLAQDDPSNSEEHLDTARKALEQLKSINSSNDMFNSATEQVAEKFTVFIDDLQGSINNGGGVSDPAISESKEAARTAGQLLDQACK